MAHEWASKERKSADIDKVAAMSHPARRRLIDLLSVNGPATVGMLAKQGDEQVGSVSHHLKMLARVGLVEEAPELARDRRESWWRMVQTSWSWSITDFDSDPAGEVIADATEREQLRGCVEKAQAWFDGRADYSREWLRAAYSHTTWLKLSPDELSDLSERISDAVTAFARELPDEAEGRESVYLFAYAMPVQP